MKVMFIVACMVLVGRVFAQGLGRECGGTKFQRHIKHKEFVYIMSMKKSFYFNLSSDFYPQFFGQ